jgi:hypothetical protein
MASNRPPENRHAFLSGSVSPYECCVALRATKFPVTRWPRLVEPLSCVLWLLRRSTLGRAPECFHHSLDLLRASTPPTPRSLDSRLRASTS